MALPILFDANLTQVERLIGAVSVALIAGDAQALEAESTALRQAMAVFSGVAASHARLISEDAVLRQRLLGISQALAHQREGLARRAVVVDRALAAVLPRDEAATYSGVAKPTFRSGAARIYANVAT